MRLALDVSGCVVQPSMASSPVGPDVGSPGYSHPPTGSVGLPFVNQSSPAGTALEESPGCRCQPDSTGGWLSVPGGPAWRPVS